MKLNKKILFAAWTCENKSWFAYQSWDRPLRNIFKRVITFDPQKYMNLYGRAEMNRKFLEVVEAEKPDYVYFWLMYPSEFSIETLQAIKKVSPKTKTLNFFGDDDVLFDNRTRYLAPFIDYPLASHREYFDKYAKDGLDNCFLTFGVNTQNFYPKKVKKEFDVTFVGTSIEDRPDYIRYLVENGINVRVYGGGWHKFPDLASYYHGRPSSDEITDIINKSRINLSFSKTLGGQAGFKGKVFEVAACNAFLLSEYFVGYTKLLKEGQELVMFNDKEELLKQVKHYLAHEKEREKIAEKAYRRVIANYSIEQEFRNILKETEQLNKKGFERDPISPDVNGIVLSQKDLLLSAEQLKEKLQAVDYVSFSTKYSKADPYKLPLQVHGIEKSDMPINCSDCYFSSRLLGNYLYYYAYEAFKMENKDRFYELLDISQLTVTSGFFLKNLDKFKDFTSNKKDLVNAQTTTFVSIPLVRRSDSPKVDTKEIEKLFAPEFELNLKVLMSQKKLFIKPFAYRVALASLLGRGYIAKYLFRKAALKRFLKAKAAS